MIPHTENTTRRWPTTDAHADIRAACDIIDCLMIEAERAGVTITGVETTTYENYPDVSINIHANTEAALAEILDMKLKFYFKSGGKVHASYALRIGRWDFGTIVEMGTVETHEHLLDEGE